MASPCVNCTRVACPRECENKNCRPWQEWFVGKWNNMRTEVRLDIERRPREQEGMCIGGRIYALPHRVDHYLHTDPCENCLCPRDLCVIPCRTKRDWLAARQDVLM